MYFIASDSVANKHRMKVRIYSSCASPTHDVFRMGVHVYIYFYLILKIMKEMIVRKMKKHQLQVLIVMDVYVDCDNRHLLCFCPISYKLMTSDSDSDLDERVIIGAFLNMGFYYVHVIFVSIHACLPTMNRLFLF